MTPSYPHAGHRLLQFHLIARCVLIVQATTTVGLAWMSPGSLTGRLLDSGGVLAVGVMGLMTVLVLGAALDVLVNDLWPGPHTVPAVRDNEHWGYLLMGATYWVLAMASTTLDESGAWVLVLNYTATGGLCCWYGWASAMRGGRRG